MAEPALLAAPPVASPANAGFDQYDPDKDPRVIESNARVEREFKAMTAPSVAPALPATVPAAEAPKLPRVLAIRAARAGFSEAELAGLNETEIRELLDDVAIAQGGERRIGTVDHPPGPAAGLNGQVPEVGAAPNPAAPAAAAPVADPRIELAKGLKAVVDEDVANGIIAYIDGVLGPLTPRIEAVENHVQEAVPYVRKLRANEADSLIDQGFGDLGPAYEKFFGKGGVNAIDHKSPQYRRRVRIVSAVRANPPKDGDIRKAIAAAGREEYADMVPALAVPDDDDEETVVVQPKRHAVRGANGKFSEADYQEAALAVPSGRSNPPKPNGRDKAIGTVGEMQSKYAADGGDELNRGEDKFL